MVSNELDEIFELSSRCRVPETASESIPSVVRGLEYYTGPVFEVELTFPIEGEDGKPVRFGSVAGGGRYDGLVGRFRGENVPATGISIGVSRLMAALQHLKKVDTQPEAGPGRRHGVRSGSHRGLPENGRGIAQRRHPRRALSRRPANSARR